MEFRSLIEGKMNKKIGRKIEKMGAYAPIFCVSGLIKSSEFSI